MTDLKRILDEATPGPWTADGPPWNRIVWSSSSNRVCFMAHSSGFDDVRDIATSNLIALAPSLAAALLKAEEALEELAKEPPLGEMMSAIIQRRMIFARAALAEISSITGGGE